MSWFYKYLFYLNIFKEILAEKVFKKKSILSALIVPWNIQGEFLKY